MSEKWKTSLCHCEKSEAIHSTDCISRIASLPVMTKLDSYG